MNRFQQTIGMMITSLAISACIGGSGDSDGSAASTAASDSFEMADLLVADAASEPDTWTPESDLLESDTQQDAAPSVPGECKLILRAEAQDAAGPCTQCKFGDYITLVGVVENPCDTPLTYTSDVACLVSEFVVLNLFHKSKSEYPMSCKQLGMEEVLQPGQSLTKTRPAGTLSAGDYELTVQFEDASRTQAELLFSVQ